jgi:MFS family permease
VIAGVGAQLLIPESPIRAPGKIDWIGAGLLTAWLTALLIGVSEAPDWGWGSGRVVGLFAAAPVVLAVWVRVEQRTEGALVDMQMMRLHGVWTTNLTALLLGFGLYSSFVLIPEFVELPVSGGVGFGASVTQAGVFLLPATTGMLLVSPLAGRLSATVGSRVPLIAGTVLTTMSYSFLAAAHGSRWEIYVCTALMGGGIGFAFGAMANLIVEAVRPDETGVATGMNTILRTIGGAIGSEISASIVVVASDHAYTTAFAVSAGVVAISVLAALSVPGGRRTLEVAAVRSTP